jgi:hypothetical protein
VALQSQLKVEQRQIDGGTALVLAGALDGFFPAESFAVRAGDEVIVDLGGVHRVTSYGVRAWIVAVEAMRAAYLGFVRVRPPMVDQFTTISVTRGAGEIISMYLPYECAGCALEFDVLVDVRQQHALLSTGKPPVAHCATCNKPAEFNDLPRRYFSKVGAEPPNPPATARRLLDLLSK